MGERMSFREKLAGFLKSLAEFLEPVEKEQKGPKFQFVFKPAQRYEMYVTQRPRVVYKGRIEEVFDDYIVLSAPLERSVPVYLPKGTEVILAIVGLPSGRYEFRTKVRDTIEEKGTIPQLVLEKPKVIYRRQKRGKPRIRMFSKADYKITGHVPKDVPRSGKVAVWDISVLGIALLFSREVPLHTRMKIVFTLPDSGIPVQALCEVVNKRWDQYSREFITGMLFLDVDEEHRAYIDKFVQSQLPRYVDGLVR